MTYSRVPVLGPFQSRLQWFLHSHKLISFPITDLASVLDVLARDLRQSTTTGSKLRDHSEGLAGVNSLARSPVVSLISCVGIVTTSTFFTCIALAWMRCHYCGHRVRFEDVHLTAAKSLALCIAVSYLIPAPAPQPPLPPLPSAAISER